MSLLGREFWYRINYFKTFPIIAEYRYKISHLIVESGINMYIKKKQNKYKKSNTLPSGDGKKVAIVIYSILYAAMIHL